jgi:hypothetical protein
MRKEAKPTFGGHQTFALRYSWLPKAINWIGEEPKKIETDQAMTDWGVGKNMVESIKYWLQATGMSQRDSESFFSISDVGKLVFLETSDRNPIDKYLEDTGTIWLLHWELCSNISRYSLGYFIFNCIRSLDFSEKDILIAIQSWLKNEYPSIPSPTIDTLHRDIDVFIRSYVTNSNTKIEERANSPLLELKLILTLDEIDNQRWFRFNYKAENQLPDWVFLYAIYEFSKSKLTTQESLPIDSIMFDSGSPGKVFKMDEDSVYNRLVKFENSGLLSIDQSSGIRNVILGESIKNGKLITIPENRKNLSMN